MLTLPTDSKERKEYPLWRGLLRYFPAALAGVAKHSKEGNDKHNPGEEMHHSRGKSSDHEDCVMRHLVDIGDLLAAFNRADTYERSEAILAEANAMCWRTLAMSQQLHERFGAPLAPGAKSEPVEFAGIGASEIDADAFRQDVLAWADSRSRARFGYPVSRCVVCQLQECSCQSSRR